MYFMRITRVHCTCKHVWFMRVFAVHIMLKKPHYLASFSLSYCSTAVSHYSPNEPLPSLSLPLSFSLQTVKAFLPWMLDNNYGYIVSIASVMAFQGVPKLSDYSASKAAALSFAESLRYELRQEKKTGITVTCICPYHIRTELFKG